MSCLGLQTVRHLRANAQLHVLDAPLEYWRIRWHSRYSYCLLHCFISNSDFFPVFTVLLHGATTEEQLERSWSMILPGKTMAAISKLHYLCHPISVYKRFFMLWHINTSTLWPASAGNVLWQFFVTWVEGVSSLRRRPIYSDWEVKVFCLKFQIRIIVMLFLLNLAGRLCFCRHLQRGFLIAYGVAVTFCVWCLVWLLCSNISREMGNGLRNHWLDIWIVIWIQECFKSFHRMFSLGSSTAD